jgi:hypothetical protein
MYTDLLDTRYAKGQTDLGWQSLAVCYALMAATLLTLWSVTNPILGAAIAAGSLALLAGGWKAAPLVRCLAACGGVVFDLTDDLRICVVRSSADGPC